MHLHHWHLPQLLGLYYSLQVRVLCSVARTVSYAKLNFPPINEFAQPHAAMFGLDAIFGCAVGGARVCLRWSDALIGCCRRWQIPACDWRWRASKSFCRLVAEWVELYITGIRYVTFLFHSHYQMLGVLNTCSRISPADFTGGLSQSLRTVRQRFPWARFASFSRWSRRDSATIGAVSQVTLRLGNRKE